MSMLLGSTPAAARFCSVRPAAPLASRAGDPVAAVDQDQLAAGVDELRVERHRHHALRHVGGFRGRERLFLRDVGHERVGHRERARAVVDRGAFVSADLVAIETGRLRAGRRHRGARGRCARTTSGRPQRPRRRPPLKDGGGSSQSWRILPWVRCAFAHAFGANVPRFARRNASLILRALSAEDYLISSQKIPTTAT